MSLIFDIGDTRFIGNHSSIAGSTPFRNAAGEDVDPTEVALNVKRPDGTVVVYRWPTPLAGELGLSREVMGRFYVPVKFLQDGAYAWRLTSTGTVEETAQGEFYVRKDKA